jgi:hypothetical protein
MIPVKQYWLTGNKRGIEGDCVRACTASLLELPRAKVPHFVQHHGNEWQFAWEDWLEKTQRVTVVRLGGRSRPDCLYLADGISPRGIRHMIVMDGLNMVHDPHPSGEGVKNISRVWLLVPRDIGAAVRAMEREQGREHW